MFEFLNRRLSKNSIAHDGIDKMVHENIIQQSPDLRELEDAGTELLKTFPFLQEDVFYSLYKPWPEIIPKEDIAPECALNHQEIEKLLEAPSYKDLKQYTQLDEFGAGLGSKALLEELCARLKEDKALQEAAEQVNLAAEHQQKADKLQQQLDEMADGSSSKLPLKSIQALQQQLEQQIQQAQNAAQQQAEKANQIMAGAQSQLRRAITAAADKAASECEETEIMLYTWGFNEGQFQRLPFEKKVELVKLLREREKFKKMAKLVGRMRNIALASRKTKLDHMHVELHSITAGDDISHVLTQC